jgi:phytoene/squalene synthetase
VTRYETFDELLGYCQLSAAPVGELVLHVFGAATPDRIALSDRICAGLQVTEHLQDLAEDRARGRVYLPDDLAGPAGIARARVLLDEGAPLVGRLRGRARLAVAGFVAGGRAALAGLERGERRHAFATTFLRTAVGR